MKHTEVTLEQVEQLLDRIGGKEGMQALLSNDKLASDVCYIIVDTQGRVHVPTNLVGLLPDRGE